MLRGDVPDDDLQQYVEERVLLTTMDKAANWARGNSLFPLGFEAPGLFELRVQRLIRSLEARVPALCFTGLRQ